MYLYNSVKWQYLTLFIDRENAKLVNVTFRLPKAQPSISPSPSLPFYSFISKYMDQRQNNQCLRWICGHACMQKSCSQFLKINRKLVWIYWIALSPLKNRPFNDFSSDRQLYCEQIFKVYFKAQWIKLKIIFNLEPVYWMSLSASKKIRVVFDDDNLQLRSKIIIISYSQVEQHRKYFPKSINSQNALAICSSFHRKYPCGVPCFKRRQTTFMYRH